MDIKENDIVLAKYLKALSHPVRLSIVRTLMDNCKCPNGCNPCNCGESCEEKNCKCGCKCATIVEKFEMSQSTISQHIKELKSVGLIDLKSRKGDYTLNYQKIKEIFNLLHNMFEFPVFEVQEDHLCTCCN